MHPSGDWMRLMPKNDAFFAPAMRIEIDGDDVSRRWQVISARLVSTALPRSDAASIEVLDSETFAAPSLGTILKVSLGYGSELPWSESFELDAVRLSAPSGGPSRFALLGKSSKDQRFEEQPRRSAFVAHFGKNVVSYSITKRQSREAPRSHAWNGLFTIAGNPHLFVDDQVTFEGFNSFLDRELRIQSVLHRFRSDGFETSFIVRGGETLPS